MNIAYVMQPHFKTGKVRAALKDQKGADVNYIVITCSPSYNGVWKYDASKMSSFERVMNGKLVCVCVPLDELEFVKKLEDITNKCTVEKIKKQQQQWFKNEVVNVTHQYKEKPDWML